MIVAMQDSAGEDQIQRVIDQLVNFGFEVHRSTGARQTVLGGVGVPHDFDTREVEMMPGVQEVHRITSPYKLAGRSFRPEGTVVKFANGIEIGGRKIVVMAGPCSVESREQLFAVTEQVAKAGARVLRGGAFKPRSSPYSFQGLGIEGLKLLRELGKVRKPVLLKRGIAATFEELLCSAEYVLAGGNYELILCERGIRTFETYTRNTMDISAIPIIHKLSHLPMTADPSHGTGRRDKVAPMARASVAAGADAMLIEVHHQPDKALSDGAQSLYPEQFAKLMDELRMIAPAVGREIA